MPVMNGLEALPKIFEIDPDIQVIMASTLTTEGAAVTMQAFKKGAAECLAKPTSTQELAGTREFRHNLVSKTKALGHVTHRRREKKGLSSMAPSSVHGAHAAEKPAVAPKSQIKLLPDNHIGAFDAIAIGSSTGGPQALLQLFEGLKGGLRQPIFLTQHMPPTFTAILADHISKASGLACSEGKDGEEIKGGRIYLAPGNYHMTAKIVDNRRVISLNQDAPENFCRPAVDPMLRSLVSVYGRKILAVILTGMGSDGAKGGQVVVEAGGVVLAQDEATSVVWGMPGAAAAAGICTRILPLAQVAGSIKEYAGRI